MEIPFLRKKGAPGYVKDFFMIFPFLEKEKTFFPISFLLRSQGDLLLVDSDVANFFFFSSLFGWENVFKQVNIKETSQD